MIARIFAIGALASVAAAFAACSSEPSSDDESGSDATCPAGQTRCGAACVALDSLMTGGVFTPAAEEFVRQHGQIVVYKPFDSETIRQLISERGSRI